jgi:hypothetical protein
LTAVAAAAIRTALEYKNPTPDDLQVVSSCAFLTVVLTAAAAAAIPTAFGTDVLSDIQKASKYPFPVESCKQLLQCSQLLEETTFSIYTVRIDSPVDSWSSCCSYHSCWNRDLG